MSTTEEVREEEGSDLSSAIPEHPQKRDLLGNFCFYLHFAVMLFIISGWLIPSVGVLLFYLGFLPLVFLHWKLNKDACMLNNIENWLRDGKWRNPKNREEGAWLVTLINDVTHLGITPKQMNYITYAVLAVLWFLGLRHYQAL